MSDLYIEEQGTVLGFRDNRLHITSSDETIREIPIELVDSISILGNVQLTSGCMQMCFKRDMPVAYYSKAGKYYGRLQSFGHVNTQRQRLQCSLYETEFALEFAKTISMGKIQNQKVVVRRYGRSKGIDVEEYMIPMTRCRDKIASASSYEEIIGNEGYAARIYFAALAALVEPEFLFCGRSRKPAKDEFNVMLNLGYSILMNIVYGSIEQKGMNPFFGFLHRDKEKHPTLASDLMEEWRPVVVDSIVMALINGHEIHKKDFNMDNESGECLITKEGLKTFLSKLELKLRVKVKYLTDVPYSVTFRQGIMLQIESLIRAMEQKDPSVYKPIEIR